MCRASGVSADIDPNAIPAINSEIGGLIEMGCVPEGTRQNLYGATVAVEWGETPEQKQILLSDAQTSGGLLLCVAEKKRDKVLNILRTARTPCAAVIGRIVTNRRRRTVDMHDEVKSKSRRDIPAVNRVLEALDEYELPRALIVDLVRRELAAERRNITVDSFPALLERVRAGLAGLRRSRLQSVINGTGVIVHTNLGRSPLAPDSLKLLNAVATSYSNLEYDLASGERGDRGAFLERALAVLCNAEAATVVNNCAAALVLIVRHFTAKKPEVIISRGELVQIGGGFRIGDILEAAGGKLREVGATNKTTLADYDGAAGKSTALILRVHRSNFFMEGFVDSPETPRDAQALAKKKKIPFVVDLGTGAHRNSCGDPIEREPSPGRSPQTRRRPGLFQWRQTIRWPPGRNHRRKIAAR